MADRPSILQKVCLLWALLKNDSFSFEDAEKIQCLILCMGRYWIVWRAAALLIQGSACVYSKKVEHLHTLVFQALNFIGEKR